MKKLIALALLSVAITLTSCKSENEKYIVGEWKLTSIEYPTGTPEHLKDPNITSMITGAADQGIIYTFNEDGTMSIKSPAGSGKGTYELTDDTHMKMIIDGKVEILEETYIDKLIFSFYTYLGGTRVFMSFGK